MLCAPEKPAAKMSTNINFLFRSRLVTDDIYWVTVVFSEACTGMVLNKSQISIPQNKPGTILPCSTNLHPITPIMLYDAQLAKKLSESLLKQGVYVISFSYPVVPKNQSRIRVQISASHSKDNLNYAIEAFAKSGRELGVIK